MDDRSYRALLDRQDWGDIHARLLTFAESRTGKRAKARAKDLAQTAILRVYSPESTWDPEKEPELLRYLMSVANSVRANENTSAAAQRNESTTARKTKRAAEQVADSSAFSESSAAESDLYARRLTLLRERMADDPNVLQYLDCVGAGKESAADICEAMDWSKVKHNAVRRRMLRAAALVARDLGGADDEDSLPSPEDDSEIDE
jgi:DNA-directed RNA polymerase specialized sigma24 family protein